MQCASSVWPTLRTIASSFKDTTCVVAWHACGLGDGVRLSSHHPCVVGADHWQGDAFAARNVIQSKMFRAFYCVAGTPIECLRLSPVAIAVLQDVLGRCVRRTVLARASPATYQRRRPCARIAPAASTLPATRCL